MSIGPVSSFTSVYASSYNLQITSSSQSTSETGSTKLANAIASRFLKKNDTDSSGGLSSSELTLSQDAFKLLDTDGDGTISADELKAGVQKQLDALKKAFDNGGADGVKSFLDSVKGTPQGEVITALFPKLAQGANASQATYTGQRHGFDAAKAADKLTTKLIQKKDTDGDGQLSNSELSGLSEDDFKALDANSDGKLSADEVKAVLKKQVQGLRDAFKSSGKSGAQDYLNSLDGTAEGNLLKLAIPKLFANGASSTSNTTQSSLQSGSVFFLSVVLQQSQTTITTSSTSLTGLNLNATV